jgi:predicted flap endonuclease-1-like 5' DNA nuclease
MLDLNPHHLLDAWWQHLLMLLVSALLGYIIGYRQGIRSINQVEDQLARLGVELEKCRKSLVVTQPEAIVANLTRRDNLRLIEGIGPKIEKLLNTAGIHNFTQLSKTSTESIKNILDQGGPQFQIHNPSTWPRQAQLASEGKWVELEKWQQELDGGV